MRYLTDFHDSARWDGFTFRSDDIVISTPAKCGTTWMQTICALLIFGTDEFPMPLATISPWLEMLTRPLDEVVADLEAQRHRRFIKSHTPLDGLPWSDDVTYVVVLRDPRDVAVSMANHFENFDDDAFNRARLRTLGPSAADAGLHRDDDPRSPEATFWAWVDNATPPHQSGSSLVRTLHHLDTFWPLRDAPNVVLLHYGDFVDDLEGSMRALADRLHIEHDDATWPRLVRAATFDEMRARAGQLAPNIDIGLWRDPTEFFHRGTNGQWRELLDADGLARYRARVNALVDDDVATWVHRGDW
jgi:hypothetical protein